ncbi:MAG: YcxB family protein [Clostridia bacterium]|nr:YcxB family protein [Clostridia bacterium]
MKFQFNVHTNETDYFEYNKFMLIRSYYGKKRFFMYRIFVALLCMVGMLFLLWNNGFTQGAYMGAILMLLFAIAVQLLLAPFMTLTLKSDLRNLKKRGKMAFSPDSTMEFYEDVFIEITPTNKTEQPYSVIERISVVDDKMIYIHVNNIMSYILPVACFESKEQCDDFFEFIKTKCANIDRY